LSFCRSTDPLFLSIMAPLMPSFSIFAFHFF
jgi:hypothetical protein